MRRLKVVLVRPRGFCAGVERAIRTVEEALARYGAPVFVRHEIVHNPFVIAGLARQGAVFADDLDAVPEGAPVVFSAHGVAAAVRGEAGRRRLRTIDATCPLVTKVHREVARHLSAGRRIILIGHAGHPEVVGTMGQAAPGAVVLVQSPAEAAALPVDAAAPYGLVTQTTLSLGDVEAIVQVLRRRIPHLHEPAKSDVCYATTNRQRALERIAGRCEAIVVLGGANSSNSRRLVEVARRAGCRDAMLLASAADLDLSRLGGVATLGATGGASTPEVLVEQLLERLSRHFALEVEEAPGGTETTRFQLPNFPD